MQKKWIPYRSPLHEVDRPTQSHLEILEEASQVVSHGSVRTGLSRTGAVGHLKRSYLCRGSLEARTPQVDVHGSGRHAEHRDRDREERQVVPRQHREKARVEDLERQRSERGEKKGRQEVGTDLLAPLDRALP